MNTVRFLQGGGYAAAGTLLLLYTFGVLEYGVKFILILAGFSLIVYGLYLMGIHKMIQAYTHNKQSRTQSAAQDTQSSQKTQSKQSSSQAKKQSKE